MILEFFQSKTRDQEYKAPTPQELQTRLDQFRGYLEGTVKDPMLDTMIELGGFKESFSRATQPEDIFEAIAKIYSQCTNGSKLSKDFPRAKRQFIQELRAERKRAEGVDEARMTKILRLMAAELPPTPST